MRKNKPIMYILIICFLISGMKPCLCESGTLHGPWCTDGASIFIIDQGELIQYTIESDDSNKLFEIESAILIDWNENLYICAKDEEEYIVAEYAINGQELRNWRINTQGTPLEMAVTKDFIIITERMNAQAPWPTGLFHAFRKSDGVEVQFQPNSFQYIDGITVGSDDNIYVIGVWIEGDSSWGEGLFRIRLEKGTAEATTVTQIHGPLASDNAGYLYALDLNYQDQIDRINLKDMSVTTMQCAGTVHDIYNMLISGSTLIIRDANWDCYFQKIEESIQRITVAISQGNTVGSLLEQALAQWNSANNSCSVQISAKAREQLLTSLLAMDDDMDIIVNGSQYEYKTLQHSGLLVELNSYPEIDEALQDWVDLSGLFGEPGHYTGIPLFIEMAYCGFTPRDLSDPIVTELPERFNNWTDIVEIARDYKNETGKYLLTDRSRMPMAFRQYLALCGMDLHFDTPLFRELMETVRPLFLEDLVYDMSYDLKTDQSYLTPTVYANVDETTLLMPPIGGCEVYAAQANSLGLLSFSSVDEDASKFLAFYCNSSLQSQRSMPGGYFLKDLSKYDRTISWEIEDRYPGLTEIPIPPMQVTNIIQNQIIPNMRCYMFQNIEHGMHIYDEIEEFMKGDGDIDSLALHLEEFTGMIENG